MEGGREGGREGGMDPWIPYPSHQHSNSGFSSGSSPSLSRLGRAAAATLGSANSPPSFILAATRRVFSSRSCSALAFLAACVVCGVGEGGEIYG